MKPIKLGLAVIWPAFWTGVPLKIALALLFLAAGVHPWEMPGLAFLILLSIPIDLWAVSLSSRTVFLERLQLEPPEGLGVTLWWQITVLTAIYGAIAYEIESGTITVAKGLGAQVMEYLKAVPVAERISIELVLWGSVATAVLLLLVVGWLYLVGWIVQRQTRLARPAGGSLPTLVQRVDLLRIPADQALTLTVFVVSGVFLTVLWWSFLPASTPHPHEDYKKAGEAGKPAKLLKPTDVIQRTESIIAQAEASVEALEAKSKRDGKDKGKPSASAKGKVEATDAAKAAGKSEPKAQPAGVHDEHESTPHSH